MQYIKALLIFYEGHNEDYSNRTERGPNQPPHKVMRQGQHSHPPQNHPQSYGWHNRGPPPMDFGEPLPPMRRSPYREPPPPEFRWLFDNVFLSTFN